jgi:hypothetical protein
MNNTWTIAETMFFRENIEKSATFFSPHFPNKTRTQIYSKVNIERKAIARIAARIVEGEKAKIWGEPQIQILRETLDMKIKDVQDKYFPNMTYQAVKYARFKYVIGAEKYKANLEEKKEIIRARKVQKSATQTYTDRLIARFGFQDVSPSDVKYYCRMATIVRNLSEQKEADRSNCEYMAMLHGGTVVIAGQDFAEQLAAKKMPLVVHDTDGIQAIMSKCWDTVWQKLPMPIL